MKKYHLFILLFFFFTVICYSQNKKNINKIKLPENFHIELYADNLKTVRALDFSDDGILFAGSKSGEVYAVTKNKKIIIIDENLDMPVGVDYYNGDLYVSSINRILKYENILNNLHKEIKPVIINNSFPDDKWHGWKFIKIGPDRKIYVPVGAPCNVCLKKDKRYSSIMRMDIDGRNLEVFAHGIRNTVGFDWHPDDGILWFTENGRDRMGDNIPPDELNYADKKNIHYGFPFIHGSNVKDPEYWDKRPDNFVFQKPVYELPAHVAALGMRFYNGNNFPEYYKNGIFIAEHGSWNRSKKIGYRITFIKLEGKKAVSYEIFASGWMKNEKYWGRPADVEIGPDGALYISDDYANCVYRIYYKEK